MPESRQCHGNGKEECGSQNNVSSEKFLSIPILRTCEYCPCRAEEADLIILMILRCLHLSNWAQCNYMGPYKGRHEDQSQIQSCDNKSRSQSDAAMSQGR